MANSDASYLTDAMRSVALGFEPRKRRPEWARKGLRRGASRGMWELYEATPLDWNGIRHTARRARLKCELNGAGDIYPPELEEYDKRKKEPPLREQERMLLLLEEAAVLLHDRLCADEPGLARAYADLHWAMDWLHRRVLDQQIENMLQRNGV